MQNKDTMWWDEPNNEKHKKLFEAVRSIYNNNRERLERNIRCLRLYGNKDLVGIGPMSYTQTNDAALPENRQKINIISSMVDTAGARISKLKTKVQFLTSGGDYTQQRQAKQLTQWMLGLFYHNDINKLHQLAFRDAEICDIGVIKHYIEDQTIKSERVFPLEVMVDPFDALHGNPRCFYQFKYVSRQTLKAMYPKFATDIETANDDIDQTTIRTKNEQEEYVVIVEAWRKPSHKKAKDGLHVICLGNVTLVDEPYTKDYFPFTFFRWSPPVIGFYGQSLAERLTSTQIEINKMLRMIQKSFHLGSAFKVFLEYGSKVSKEHVNNDIGSLVYYHGKEPIYYTPQTVHPEFFTHLKYLVQSAYEEAGISQLSSSSKLPAGIDAGSGRAVREYNNIETERFALVAQDYEDAALVTADIYVDLAKDIASDGGDVEVVSHSKTFVEKIKWSDVAPKDEMDYIMQKFATSLLPQEPAGRLATVQEMVQGGLIPQDFAIELLDFPDMHAYTDIANAQLEDQQYTLEQLINDNYLPPEPYQNLSSAIKFMQQAYLKARRQKVSEVGLENIRRWISTADSMLQSSEQATATAAAITPQAAPAPPPVSNLVPNVPAQ